MKKIYILMVAAFSVLSIWSEPVKSMLAADSIVETMDSWENPYITNGLVAMWDGEWNIAGGVHDPNSSIWVDIAGGREISIPANDGGEYEWSDNSLAMLGNGGIWNQFEEYFPVIYTIEFVGSVDLNGGVPSASTAVMAYNAYARFMVRTNKNISAYVGGVGEITIGNDFLPRTSISFTIGDKTADVKSVFYKNGAILYRFSGVNTPAIKEVDLFCYEKAGRYRWPEGAFAEVCAIRLYSHALTPEEIAHNAALDAERFGLQ